MSFLAPFGLLLGLLAVPLAALYFLRLRRRKVAVSSLMLWHAVRRSEQLASPFQRFRRNLLLLLQLLALLLLVLAFARPYLQTEARLARAVVLVLDTSASMGATDGSAAGDTRFDQARAEARALLDELGPGDEAMIVSAGPVTEVVAPFTRDKGALSVALDGVRLTQAAASLEEGLRLALSLARTRPDVEVVVLSDGGPDDLSGLPAGEVDVRYLRTGTQATNAGIVALDLRRSPVSEAERQLFVTVQNQGDVANRGSVELFLDGELVGLRTERLDPSVPVAMVFDLPPLVTGVVEVKLSWPDDRLPADDTAYAVVARTAAHYVLLVGNDPLLARILAGDPRIDARQVPASGVTPELLAASDAVLFAGAVPDGIDGLSYAVLGPQHGGPVQFAAPQKAPRVVGWRRTHPLVRFTQWDKLVVGASYPVTDAAGMQPVVEGDWGPLVLAGERAGGRVVQLAFDPLQSDLPLRVAWPVFVMNTVGWLTEGRGTVSAASSLPTGQPYVRTLPEVEGSAVVSGPAPAVARLDEGVLRVTGLTDVGVYEVSAGDGAWRTRFAANLLSADESRIRPRADLTLGGGVAEASARAVQGRRELWRPLLLLALGVLLLEWLLYHRRAVA